MKYHNSFIDTVGNRPANTLCQAIVPRRFELIEVGTPFIVLLCAQFVQILPGIKAGIVAIIKKEPQRVIPDGLDRRYLHVLLAGLQNALTGSMSFDFGR